MTKSEHRIQDEIRLELSKYGIVLRLNSGKFWQGKRVWSKEFNQYVLINMHPITGCPKGTSDLLFIGNKKVGFIECKNDKGLPSEEQINFIQAVRYLGHNAGIARSAEEARQIIEKE